MLARLAKFCCVVGFNALARALEFSMENFPYECFPAFARPFRALCCHAGGKLLSEGAYVCSSSENTLTFVLVAAAAVASACSETNKASHACAICSFLPNKRAARAVVQYIVARGCVGVARYELINGERELRVS